MWQAKWVRRNGLATPARLSHPPASRCAHRPTASARAAPPRTPPCCASLACYVSRTPQPAHTPTRPLQVSRAQRRPHDGCRATASPASRCVRRPAPHARATPPRTLLYHASLACDAHVPCWLHTPTCPLRRCLERRNRLATTTNGRASVLSRCGVLRPSSARPAAPPVALCTPIYAPCTTSRASSPCTPAPHMTPPWAPREVASGRQRLHLPSQPAHPALHCQCTHIAAASRAPQPFPRPAHSPVRSPVTCVLACPPPASQVDRPC